MEALSTYRIEEKLVGLNWRVRSCSITDSTNSEIKRAIGRGEPEGLVITSLLQEGGYGRQGRQWSSPLGGLYLSLLLRPGIRLESLSLRHEEQKVSLPTLSLLISIAERRTLARFTHDDAIKIKWPNDIVYTAEEKVGKICGISVEVVGDAVCVGIGTNLFRPPVSDETTQDTIIEQGKYRLVYLADLVEDWKGFASVQETNLTSQQIDTMELVAAVLLSEVDSVYNTWLVEGFSPFRDEYRSDVSLLGQTVQVLSISGDLMHEGEVCDVDDEGFLCLRDTAGKLIRVHSGEVHLK